MDDLIAGRRIPYALAEITVNGSFGKASNWPPGGKEEVVAV